MVLWAFSNLLVTMAGVRIRALTERHPIKPTSLRCHSAWQLNLGRPPLIDAENLFRQPGPPHSPNYLNKYGRPKHPLHLAQHRCLTYSYTVTTEVWHFTKGAKSASVQPSGPLRVNNGDAMMPALIAGTGLGILPEFFIREELASNRLE